jgi:hypothetical protein
LIIGDFGLAYGSAAGLELDCYDINPGCYGSSIQGALEGTRQRSHFRASHHWLRFMSLLAPHLGGRQGLDVVDLLLAPTDAVACS